MVDIAMSVAAKIAEYVAAVGRPFRYLWNYKTNLENLKNEVEKLEAKRDTVQLSIKPREDPMPDVKLWQENANRIIVEVSEVVGDNPEQANIQCCKGFSCPNWMNRYQLSKKAAGKLKAVVGLEQEAADFNDVSYPTIPEQTFLQPSKVAFESRKSILKDIIDALYDRDVNMVGIYGMGCIGKTTLAKEVASEAKQHNLFDKIVFVEVSGSPDIRNIQGVIAYNLGLQFKDETVPGRANRLCDQLKKEGKILLILDNIWEKIDLEEVGIPFENDHKGLKVLLTTRSRSVLTNDMDCQHNFQVHTLNEADAWSLFKNIAGTCTERPDLQSIAPEVAKLCGGLPLAIVTTAKALRNKEEYAWIHALEKLKSPSSEHFEGIMTREVYRRIKLSYDYLDGRELQEIFLLCSRMGHTNDVSIRDLFMYGLGLGFFVRSKTLEKAQCMVEDSVKKLKDNSLLLDAPIETRDSLRYGIPDGERFAMHEIICDVARSIDCERGNVCIVIDDVISCSWAKKNILKNCTSITLHNISKVPKEIRLVFPQLEFFYMKTKKAFSRIADDFFLQMSKLKVLHLIEMNLSPLPTSLSHLVNLRTLCLDACKLGDIADIGKFEKLEILSFHSSEIKKLPEEMCKLTSIRLLDLTHCSTLEIIPPNVISCFTQLEAFYMYGTLIRWEDGGLNIVGKNASLDELKHLRDCLTTLEICIPNVKMSKGLLSPRLKRYKISIDCDWISPPKNSRMLRVKLNTNDNADEVISQLKGIKQLELCADLKDDFTDSKQSVSLDALFSLESLSLEDLNFEKICNFPLVAESFFQLRTITVHKCDKLTNIFSFSIVEVLPKLQEIRVSTCKNMEEIFAIEREDDVNNTELIHEIQFNQLCSVTLTCLPQLKSFCHRVKTTSQLQFTSSTNDGEIISEDMIDIPKSLFNEKVVFPNLETLEISDISAEKIWHNELPTMSSSFQNLNRLIVQSCDNLKELFSSSMVNSFVKLQYLEISECSLLEGVVFKEELREEEMRDTQFPFLKEMKIKYCPNLKAFISNDKIGFPSLKAMEIMVCPKYKEFIFNDKVDFPSLEKMVISGMDNLESIWDNQFLGDSFSFPELKSVEVNDCQELKTIFPTCICGRLSSLESLTVKNCGLVKEIFDLQGLNLKENHSIKITTQLRELYVDHMSNLRHIWNEDPKGMLSYGNMQKVTVSLCPNLENLFPGSVAKSLLNLVSLDVSDCGLLKEIIAKEAADRLLFPKLSSLQLHNLPQLITFYTGQTIDVSCLERLALHHCDNVKSFISEFPGFYETIELEGTNEGLPNLEVLQLSGKAITMEWLDQVPGHVFRSLKSLKLNDLESTDLPLHFIQKFGSLEKLSLNSSSYKEIFSHGEVNERPQIKHLVLSGLFYLKQIWKQGLNIDPKFQNLEILEVRSCFNLINLMPSSASFQNLRILQVWGCDGLKNLLTSSTAKSLVLLEELEVFDCKLLIEVVANDRSVTEEINFRRLKSLSLTYLQSLASFCSTKHTLNFPILESLVVNECPKMKIFSEGVTSTPIFHKLELNWEACEQSWEVGLNTILKQNMERRGQGMRVGMEEPSSHPHFPIDIITSGV